MIGPTRTKYTAKEINTVIALPAVHAQMNRSFVIESRLYDVPNVCGYSADGSTMYLDRDLPLWKYIDMEIDVRRFALLHARVEKAVRDAIAETSGNTQQNLLIYLRMTDAADDPFGHCHDFATVCEEFGVTTSYLDTGTRFYREFIAGQCKAPAQCKSLPPDLDPALLKEVPHG